MRALHIGVSLAFFFLAGLAANGQPGDKRRVIPFTSAYSTAKFDGIKQINADFMLVKDGKRLKKVFKEPYGFQLQNILTRCKSGASDILLVRGKDITQAVQVTAEAIAG